MNILLTNDDGYKASGINALFESLSLEHNVYLIAEQPDIVFILITSVAGSFSFLIKSSEIIFFDILALLDEGLKYQKCLILLYGQNLHY